MTQYSNYFRLDTWWNERMEEKNNNICHLPGMGNKGNKNIIIKYDVREVIHCIPW